MRNFSLLLIAIIAQNVILAQSIPEISGETIDQKSVRIPRDLAGKYSLLCFASSMKAEGDLVSWLDPVYQKFIAKTGMMDDMYDVNVLFIPVLTGTNVTFAANMKKKFREEAQEDLRPHVLFCEGRGKDILESLGIERSDAPHVYLLNKEGKIIYKTSGAFSEEKFDAMEDLLE